MPHKLAYRLACLQGKHPTFFSEFVRVTPIVQLMGEDNQGALETNLGLLINKKQTLQAMVTEVPSVIMIRNDATCTARALFFGTLISASVAIKTQDDSAPAIQETLQILLQSALELKQHYQAGWAALDGQLGAFRTSGNALIYLIQAVQQNTVLTAELVYLMGKDSDQALCSVLNLAAADLLRYILYKEACALLHGASFSEREVITYLYGEENTREAKMTDILMKPFYHKVPRILVCNHLRMATEGLLLERHLNLHLYREGLVDHPVLFAFVKMQAHVHLLLDVRVDTQVQLEFAHQWHLQARDLEQFFQSEVIRCEPRVQRVANNAATQPFDRKAVSVVEPRYTPLRLPANLVIFAQGIQKTETCFLAWENAFRARQGESDRYLNEMEERIHAQSEAVRVHLVCQLLAFASELKKRARARGEDLPGIHEMLHMGDRCWSPKKMQHKVPLDSVETRLPVQTVLPPVVPSRQIPPLQQTHLNTLRLSYTLSEQTHKLAFLNALEAHIIANPHQTYRKCFREVLGQATPAVQGLFSPTRAWTHRFFAPHRLHTLVEELVALDRRTRAEQAPVFNACCSIM